MQDSSAALKFYERGRVTVVAVAGDEIQDDMHVLECQEELERVIKDEKCERLIFDLKDAPTLSSMMLRVMFSLRQLGAEVCVCNASEVVQEVLKITNLNKLIQTVDSPYE